MTRRSLALVAATVALQAFVLALPVAHASPGIRILDEEEMAQHTDLRARVRVLAVERTARDGRIEVRSLVQVLGVSGRRAGELRRGARITFRTSCRDEARPEWMHGYPTDHCSAGFWRMPSGLDVAGHTVEVALRALEDDAHQRAFEVVTGTWPSVGYAFGELGDRRLHARPNTFSRR